MCVSFSLLGIRFQRFWVWICIQQRKTTTSIYFRLDITSLLHLLSIRSLPCCQCIKINTNVCVWYMWCVCVCVKINSNKHVYRQSQVRKPIDSEVKWVECALIIGTGCWVQVYLILDSSICLWVGIQSAGDLVSQTSQLRILYPAEEDNLIVSVRFENRLPVPEHQKYKTNMYMFV